MAYEFVAASSQYLTAQSSVTSNPVTLAFWFKGSGQAGCGLSIGKSGDLQRNQVFVGQASGNVINAASADSTGSGISVNSIGTFTNNLWSHAAAVFGSNSSRTAYCNGGGSATNTTTINPSPGFDTVFVGARPATTVGGFFTGDLAEVGIWNAALTAAEIASLAKGMTCDKVRPQSLVFYAPLVRDLVDVKGGLAITNNNTATVANHPRVYA
jgi:hypothetical protein